MIYSYGKDLHTYWHYYIYMPNKKRAVIKIKALFRKPIGKATLALVQNKLHFSVTYANLDTSYGVGILGRKM